MSVGLGRDQALSATQLAVRESRWRNALGTGVLLLAATWIAALCTGEIQDHAQLLRHKLRYSLAL